MNATTVENARRLEESRRVAMLNADIESLRGLLSDDLVYTHSVGFKDSKREYVEKISKGVTLYSWLEFGLEKIVGSESAWMVSGEMHGELVMPHKSVDLHLFYLAGWMVEGDGRPRLVAWQGTTIPPGGYKPAA